MNAGSESGLELIGQHAAAVAGSLTVATAFVFAAYNWLIARGGTDGFLRWLDSKTAEESQEAARRFWEAFALKSDKDPSLGLSMVVDGLEAFRSATARGASRRRALWVCEWAFVIMVVGCLGQWATLLGGPQWVQAIPFIAWTASATVGGFFAVDIFRFVKKTGGPPPRMSEAKPAPHHTPAATDAVRRDSVERAVRVGVAPQGEAEPFDAEAPASDGPRRSGIAKR